MRHLFLAIILLLPEGAYFYNGTYYVAPNYETCNPLWVAEFHVINAKRADRDGITFKADNRIPLKYRVDDRDYRGSGFDKGHMAPAMNETDSKEDLESTFLYTNACPQYPEFNRGIWKKLEAKVYQYDKSWIITVPFYEDKESIKVGRMWLPSHFGKAVKYNDKEYYWIIPHRREIFNPDLEAYRVTKGEFESRSGLHLWSVINEPRAKVNRGPETTSEESE